MDEYIERNKVKSAIYEISNSDYLFVDAVIDAIDNTPAADVALVVHGRWIEADDGDGVVCSECGTDFCTLIYRREDLKYCICGAKMDGGDKDD